MLGSQLTHAAGESFLGMAERGGKFSLCRELRDLSSSGYQENYGCMYPRGDLALKC